MLNICAGYLACARCSNTGALVLIEPVSTINRTDKPLPPPKTERCPNCSGSGKVSVWFKFIGSKLFTLCTYKNKLDWINWNSLSLPMLKVCSLPMKLPERHICKMPQNVKHFAKCHKTLSIVIWEGVRDRAHLFLTLGVTVKLD